MKENKYDDKIFFRKYSQMDRSVNGLQGAGEWHIFQKMLPDFDNRRVLDLGCGFGWHCEYAMEHGAQSVVGVDISQKMLAQAERQKKYREIQYLCQPIEEVNFAEQSFDIVISSLAFHYIEAFEDVCKRVWNCLSSGGYFVFSVEHPVFTAQGNQEWSYGEDGEIRHWPVDDYFIEGRREALFLGEKVTKYHRTLTTYVSTLLRRQFKLLEIVEPTPDPRLLEADTRMKEELRRPMMLLVAVQKE